MHKLWRRENEKKTPHFEDYELTEAAFIEQITKIIKLIRQKEDSYYKLAVLVLKQSEAEVIGPYLQENESLSREECERLKSLSTYRGCQFFKSKTYLYTVFMRLNEILQQCRQKIKILGNPIYTKELEESRIMIAELYNNQTYFQKHDIVEMLQFFSKNHRERVSRVLPRKKVHSLAPIPKKFIMQRIKSVHNPQVKLRSTVSVELQKPKTNSNDLLSLKLLATEIRIEERKKKKKNVFKMYEVLQIKPIAVEATQNFRLILEENMLARNMGISEQRRKWEKRCLRRN